jgi:hypothetical protein
MTRARTAVGVLAVTGLLGAVATTGSAQTRVGDSKKVTVAYNKNKAQRATIGSYHLPDGQGRGELVTAKYPLKTANRISIRGGGRLTIRTSRRADQVYVRLARSVDGKEVKLAVGTAKPATRRTRTTWRWTLPKNLRNAKIIGVLAEYRNGYADFEIGARPLK